MQWFCMFKMPFLPLLHASTDDVAPWSEVDMRADFFLAEPSFKTMRLCMPGPLVVSTKIGLSLLLFLRSARIVEAIVLGTKSGGVTSC